MDTNGTLRDKHSAVRRADTASAFNISVSDVRLTGVRQVARRVLYVKVSAALPVDVAPDASEEDVRAALNVKSLSADDPISLLSRNPDKFFGRTTKVSGSGDTGWSLDLPYVLTSVKAMIGWVVSYCCFLSDSGAQLSRPDSVQD